MNIQLHIERLILDGIALGAGERPGLQAAVEMELGRLLAERGIADGLASGVALDSVRGGAVQLTGAPGASGLGNQVARAVYGGDWKMKGATAILQRKCACGKESKDGAACGESLGNEKRLLQRHSKSAARTKEVFPSTTRERASRVSYFAASFSGIRTCLQGAHYFVSSWSVPVTILWNTRLTGLQI